MSSVNSTPVKVESGHFSKQSFRNSPLPHVGSRIFRGREVIFDNNIERKDLGVKNIPLFARIFRSIDFCNIRDDSRNSILAQYTFYHGNKRKT
ncbi:hypothetical protein NY2A_b415L [Paramecium bursaria Chlorella virus NY2A]|uniref:Uncharacterized protein b415L n=1 Tax=Paramecium bursaria Chlorella virus NY2A TaxID=46021 RepID=A7IWU0_PBCVN|nr:hypothetical protein NY2A_b415L [Paramecium bursaria Chlorella virus NY2A]YP_001498443.1 hypothetical protein AR158_c362L [Paramecium bursaria Chlorella virus AR158]ABT14814.1 hypothetical protein NY2A_b415L [Paramecium bursaria Chlorella virus NY2A]ABU43907.1 hypothetical protein AR158_c362L [Paramecium bursaria Chlorella virus AR158]